MLPPDLKVSVRIAAELFYHSYRVRKYLARIPPGGSNEHRRLIDGLLRVLQQFEQQTINGFAALWEIPLGDESREPAIAHVQLGLRRLSNCFVTTHELLAYLPREAISPEVVFGLKTCFPKFFEDEPSVVLGYVVNAFEFDIIEILKEKLPEIGDIFPEEERIPVLQLAICDCDSSLAYAVLAHEVGHAIDSREHISSQVVEDFVAAPKAQGDFDALGTGPSVAPDLVEMLRSWCAEICADLIASRFVGPAPMLSLLSMEYCIHPEYEIYVHSETHPSTRTRLQVVGDDSTGAAAALIRAEMDSYDDAWRLNIKQQLPHTEEQERVVNAFEFDFVEQLHNTIAEKLIRPMAERVRAKLGGLTPPHLSFEEGSLKRCVIRLQLGSPVSAQGKPPEALAIRVREHECKYRLNPFEPEAERCKWEEWEEERRGAFKTLCDEFTEKPLDVPTILLAGYRRRSEIIDDLYQIEKGPLADSKAVEELCESLAGLDRLIGNSIVTARVHRNVCERLDENRRKRRIRGKVL